MTLVESNMEFVKPVPLLAVINILIEEWEDEGLYDHVAKIEALEAKRAGGK